MDCRVKPGNDSGGESAARGWPNVMIVVADAIRLTLFPAMMAFAASSDLLTMTISNRVSLILVGGFAALAAIGGVSAADVLSHLAAGCVVLVAAFGLFARGVIRGGAAQPAAAPG